MNTIFREGDNLYKIVRETPKTYFYKMILPTQIRVGNKSLLFSFNQTSVIKNTILIILFYIIQKEKH